MISILGCGWYGLALGKALVAQDVKVNGSTTSAERLPELAAAGLNPFVVQLSGDGSTFNEDFFKCDTLIISIPPKLKIGDGDSYIAKLQTVISNIIKHDIRRIIYVSSTGVYPDNNTLLNEQSVFEPDTTSAKILYEAEELFRNQTDFKTAIIRFGGLVGPRRNPGRFFAGKQNIPNGQAPVNLVHLDDCIGLTQAILNQQAFGHTFNACSPHHPHKSWFYTQASLNAGLPQPHFVDELKEWKTIYSVNVPAILNYNFKVNDWQKCFEGNCF